MGHMRKKGPAEETNQLAEYRKRLQKEKRQSQCYVEISVSDIPENAHIRPIYELAGQIVTAEPERYEELIDCLRGYKHKGDES